MTRARLLPAVALAAGLLAVMSGTSAQPPGSVPGRPQPGGRAGQPGPGQPGREAAVPLVPKTSGAFLTLKVSDLLANPDLKPVLAELAKQPDALAGLTEVIGVSPLELDRVTLFWSRFGPHGGSAPILVVTTREPFNEARVLKALRADPVFDADGRRGHSGSGWGAGGSKPAVKMAPEPDLKGFPEPQVKDPFGPKTKVAPPPFPKGPEPKLSPPPPVEKNDDPCGGSSDGGPTDPLFYALNQGPFDALFLIDEHTLVFLPGGPDGEFATMALLAGTLKKNATGPLADALASAGRHTFAAGLHLTPLFREFDRDRKVPPELVPYTALFAARTAVLIGGLDKDATFELALAFDDAAAARRAAPVLEEGIATVAEKLGAEIDEMKARNRPAEKALLPILTPVVAGLKKATVKADGTTVAARADIDAGPVAAKALGEMLQAVQSQKRARARMNNLKQIGLALHSYHDVYGRFPSNVYGPKGEPLLSWRVHLLPYLEEDELYKQFKMDEPWDGPNNKKLIEKMPKVYTAPDREHAKGKTFYQGFIGPNPLKGQPPKGIFGRPWLQEGETNGTRIFEITDGTSNTIAVIEARDGVIWSKPDDLPFGGPVPALGEKGWDRTPALRFDGSVLLFPTNLKPEEFWPFITINGGEVTPDIENDRGLRHSLPSAPPAGALPANPVKRPDGVESRLLEVRELEDRVAVMERALRAEEQRAAAATALAEETARAVAAGSATAEALAKARAAADEAKKAAQIRRDELQLGRERLRAARFALEKEPKLPEKK
jgi:hypothetical protein